MVNDQDLQFEENRQLLIDLNKSISDLSKLLDNKLPQQINTPDQINVKGEVSLSNPVESLEINNLEDVKDWLVELGSTLKIAIEANKTKPVTEVSVKNIDEAKVDSVKIEDMPVFIKTITDSMQTIIENIPEPKITVQKQDFPTSAKDAIPVRLSDGKTFYKAISQAISAAGVATSVNAFDADGILRNVTAVESTSTPGVWGLVVLTSTGADISGGTATVDTANLLLETGDAILLETGDLLLTE